MRRHVQGLHDAGHSPTGPISDGLLLVRVERAQHRWAARRRFYPLRFSIIEPKEFTGRSFAGCLSCTPKALWKLNWFLRDFGYDTELLGRDEIDDNGLVGLRGVVKINGTAANDATLLNLDGFAPASHWDELSGASASKASAPQVAS